MLTLRRTVRFAVNPGDDGSTPPAGDNGYAGVPALRGLGRYYELDIACRGRASAVTGYFMDIKTIDRAARATIIPAITRAVHENPAAEPAAVLAACLAPLNAALGGSLDTVAFRLSPYYSVEMSAAHPDRVLVRQRFELAAAHRLNVPSLSPEENRQIFGRCNHPSGHGHNYIVEPAVRLPAAAARPDFLTELERVVKREILDPYDHTHFNIDTAEFREGSGLNPSVENIAKVFFERLKPAVAPLGGELAAITVWETEKTSATYPA